MENYKTKKTKVAKWLLASFVTVISLSAFAGAESSGGAGGIFCPTTVANQPRVQLLDLYEGRINEGLEIPESNVPYEEQITQALNKLSFDFSLQMDMRKTLTDLKANHKFLPAGVGIHTPSDLGTDEAVVMPTDCTMGAIGFYESSGTLKISSDAFNSLSETQKAAFWMHEAFYKLVRFYKESEAGLVDAKSTRIFVSKLFATNSTLQALVEASAPGNWRNLKTIKAHSMQNSELNSLQASAGKESWLLTGEHMSPLKLPSRNQPLKLVAEAEGGKIIPGVLLGCTRFRSPPTFSKESMYFEKNLDGLYQEHDAAVVIGKIPADCQALYISVSHGGNEIAETKVRFKLFYGDQEVLWGTGKIQNNGYSKGTDVSLPLYND
ncbi:MAG: hypothetical protein V4654_06255 [Bdellovibrionota bacterium]